MKRSRPCRAVVPACAILLAASASAQQRAATAANTQAVEIRKLPPEDAQRITSFRQALQPSAASWVQQEVRSQTGHTPDVTAIRGAVRQRFGAGAGRGASLTGADIDALVAVVMEQAAESDQSDLQQQMNQMAAINEAKAQLRAVQQRANQLGASATPANANEPCRLPACLELVGQLKDAAGSAALRQHPVRATIPANASYKQIASAASQMQTDLDNLSDMSQEMQIKLQMTQDQYSKLMEALSNLMKTTSDTEAGIIANMK